MAVTSFSRNARSTRSALCAPHLANATGQTEGMSVDPIEPNGAPFEPIDHKPERKPLSRARRKALIFGPILAAVAVVITLLGVPWKLVAAIVAVFVLWLLIEG